MTTRTETARILEVTSYPPPRAGWGIRVEYLKKRLEIEGHQCVVLNIGTSRRICSDEYETVMGGVDFVRKVWRFSRQGFLVHAHANGDSAKGLLLALTAELLNLACGRRCYLTFHAGVIQRHFPREKNRWLAPAFWLLFVIPRKIICNSEAVKNRIGSYGIPARKIVPIPAFSRQYLDYSPVTLSGRLEAFFDRFPSIVFTYVRLRRLFYPTTLINGMALVMKRRLDVGLIVCGGGTHADPGVWSEVQAAIKGHDIEDRICFVEDLDHDAFLTVLRRAALYVRTHFSDGVASSVLESLALGIPVVACDNGTRPQGAVTYPPEDAKRMAETIEHVLDHRAEVVAAIANVEMVDTLSDEVALLTS
jgi:glycosyltransferase involved in cell wall biosynthesis